MVPLRPDLKGAEIDRSIVIAEALTHAYVDRFGVVTQAYMLQYTDPGTPFYWNPCIGTMPAWFSCFVGGRVWICVTGTANNVQAVEQFLAWSEAPIPTRIGHLSGILGNIGARIFNLVFNTAPVHDLDPLIAGHSYGAALALVIGAYWQTGVSNSYPEVITFGNPKPGFEDTLPFFDRLKPIRWVNAGDGITWLPPTPLELSRAYEAAPRAVQRQWIQYRQPGGGRRLYADGHWESANEALTVTNSNDVNLIRWAAGAGGAVGEEHSLLTYLRRLYLYRNAAIAREEADHLPSPLPIQSVDPGPIGGALPVVVDPQAGSVEDPKVPLNYAAVSASVTAGSGFRSVFWMQREVARSATVSKAQGLSKTINKIQKLLLSMDVVQAAGLADAMAAWLNAARTGSPSEFPHPLPPSV